MKKRQKQVKIRLHSLQMYLRDWQYADMCACIRMHTDLYTW